MPENIDPTLQSAAEAQQATEKAHAEATAQRTLAEQMVATQRQMVATQQETVGVLTKLTENLEALSNRMVDEREAAEKRTAAEAENAIDGETLRRHFEGKDMAEVKSNLEAIASEHGLTIERVMQLSASDYSNVLTRTIHPDVTPDAERLMLMRQANDQALALIASEGKDTLREDQTHIQWGVMERVLADPKFDAAYPGAQLLRDMHNSTTHSDMIPVILSQDVTDMYERSFQVSALFPTVPMNDGKVDLPIIDAFMEAFRLTEPAAASAFFSTDAFTQLGSDTVELRAELLGVPWRVSNVFMEDGLQGFLNRAPIQAARALARHTEDAHINGSAKADRDDLDNTGADGSRLWNNTTGASGPEKTTQSADPRFCWDGLRKLTETAQQHDMGDPTTLSGLENALNIIRSKMGEFGVEADRLVHLWSLGIHAAMTQSTRLLTLDKAGPRAVIYRGQIGFWDGVPTIITPRIYEYLNADGVYDATTTNRTICMTVFPEKFVRGIRRGPRLASLDNPLIGGGQRGFALTAREDFAKRGPASEAAVAYGYNVKAAPFA